MSRLLLGLLVGFPLAALAQQGGWVKNQVNTTMCFWEQVRASVVRNTLYLDGGNLYWTPGLSSGEYGPPITDGNPLGLVYTLNFSTPFNAGTNTSAILQVLSKAGNGAANNIAPNYYDGAMLANDGEFFLYGGLLKQTAAFTPPRAEDVTAYQAYQSGVEKSGFRPGFLNDRLNDDITRYLAYGGAANAPSENKAFYFSGMHSPSWGPIYNVQINESQMAVNVSDTLITLDMSTQQQEKWKNTTVPDFIKGRAGPELVWVPVGAQGILVALGGVVYPEFAYFSRKTPNEPASKAESGKFISTIDIYDIASGNWYQQPTSGGPTQLARGCAVVAPAQDGSSFNIYYYGGYDGINSHDTFSDDVWILSLPSFMWMKVYSSNKASHGRAGHKCVMPYPDQMIVVGGYTSVPESGVPPCLDGGILQVFNLTSGKWLSGYDPNSWNKYGVPDMIFNMIGGSETGGATMTTPTPTGWATSDLAKVFQTPYPTSKITTFYPYGSAGPGNNTRSDFQGGGGGSGIPGYLPPVLGVICGLMFLSAIAVIILLYRRRKLLRGGANSEAGTDENGNRIFSWLRAQPSENKAPTVTTAITEEGAHTPFSPDMESATHVAPSSIVHHEMADTQVAELPDTSPRVELQDTGLTPVEIINKHTHFAQHPSSIHNGSYYSSVAQTDHASSVSRSSAGQQQQQQQQQRGVPAGYQELRPDSPPLGTPDIEPTTAAAAAAAARRGESGVSGLSERDRAHLRHMSDTSVSSVETNNRPQPVLEEEPTASPEPQLSPPSPRGEATDYITARGSGALSVSPGPSNTGSPLRRSVFYENEDDMGGRRA